MERVSGSVSAGQIECKSAIASRVRIFSFSCGARFGVGHDNEKLRKFPLLSSRAAERGSCSVGGRHRAAPPVPVSTAIRARARARAHTHTHTTQTAAVAAARSVADAGASGHRERLANARISIL